MMTFRVRLPLLFASGALLLAAACSGASGGATSDPGGTVEPDAVGDAVTVADVPSEDPATPPADVAADTGTGDPGTPDTAPVPTLGTCTTQPTGAGSVVLPVPGDDPFECSRVRTECEVIAGGTFTPSETCAGLGPSNPSWGAVPFVQPYRVCTPAREGEPAGKTDGEVCTWTLISGCTESGRRFDDYASCGDVMTQRPYVASKPAKDTDPADPRLTDTAYMAEIAWSAKQVEASGCVCCHSKRKAPKGPSNWYVDGDGIWLDGVRDSGLALFLNKADSRALGAYPAAANNGFDRTELGIPTDDIPRMRKVLEAEWARRGLTDAYAATVPAFGGPLVEQLSFVPDACTSGEGIDAEGRVVWGDFGARYVYVLEADAKSPVVPPNLDEPEGTLWLVEVPSVAPLAASGIPYGQVAGDLRQRIPASGAPAALESGKTYFLVVLIDIGLPAVRCLFTAP